MTADVLFAASRASGATGAPRWLSYAAVAIAAVSLVMTILLTLSNRSIAKRALRLSERQEARREAKIDLYMNESVSWHKSSDAGRLLGFHIQAANSTDRPTSILAAELHLSYDVKGVVTVLKVTYTSAVQSPAIGVGALDLPIRLDANDAKTGWLLVDIPAGLIGNRNIDRYDLVIRDVHGIEETRQVTIFREATDEQTD